MLQCCKDNNSKETQAAVKTHATISMAWHNGAWLLTHVRVQQCPASWSTSPSLSSFDCPLESQHPLNPESTWEGKKVAPQPRNSTYAFSLILLPSKRSSCSLHKGQNSKCNMERNAGLFPKCQH